MLNSAAVQSSVFRRLTNRERPRLTHPTANAFDAKDWTDIISQDELSDRDISLTMAAMLLGLNIKKLRKNYIDHVFSDLSGADIVAFAIADANRTWSILRELTLKDRIPAEAGVIYATTAGKTPLEVGVTSGPAGAEDLNTSCIDALPHWFARAAVSTGNTGTSSFDYGRMGRVAQFSLSTEHAYREVWQEILWEGWLIDKDNGNWSVQPRNLEDQALWRVWEWREQSLFFQHAFLSMQMERITALELRSDFLKKTAVAVRDEPEGRVFVLGVPDRFQAVGHRSAMETIESSYVAPFVDQPLAGTEGTITPRLLELAICVLQDAASVLLPKGTDVEYRTAADIERLSCSVRREEIVLLVSEALEINREVASMCVERLTSRPFADLAPLFASGLWHRPLVATSDETHLMLVNGALIWGSPLRRVERWLQEGARADLSKTPLGLQYEAHLRRVFQDALNNNDVLKPVARTVTSLSDNQSVEEIDCLIRIGATVLVIEIKCLLAPADPIERYDYVRKLEEACDQATRKAAWLKSRWSDVSASLGLGDGGESPRIVPLVVVNQSSGTSCRFGECVVIDAHFLELFLGSGSYSSGSVSETGDQGRIGFALQHLYADAAGAEACIPGLFEAHPGLTVFRKAVRWDASKIPLVVDGVLLIAFPTMDASSFAEAMPDPESILPGSLARRD